MSLYRILEETKIYRASVGEYIAKIRFVGTNNYELKKEGEEMTEGEREVCDFCRDWGMLDCEKCELKKKRENQIKKNQKKDIPRKGNEKWQKKECFRKK